METDLTQVPCSGQANPDVLDCRKSHIKYITSPIQLSSKSCFSHRHIFFQVVRNGFGMFRMWRQTIHKSVCVHKIIGNSHIKLKQVPYRCQANPEFWYSKQDQSQTTFFIVSFFGPQFFIIKYGTTCLHGSSKLPKRFPISCSRSIYKVTQFTLFCFVFFTGPTPIKHVQSYQSNAQVRKPPPATLQVISHHLLQRLSCFTM